MILKTKTFQEAAKTILMAVDNNAANIELVVKENNLYLNVTNKEYYVSIKQELEQPETFNAVVDASLFLSLIAGISTEEFELKIKDNKCIFNPLKEIIFMSIKSINTFDEYIF
jgi:DNA polymerase III sliding clamp (beta) subunit (PCNA family)